jgi:6-phosphogluconolactonase
VAAQYVDKLQAWRISLTMPVINAARHVAVLVVGEAKAAVLAEVAKEVSTPVYPIQGVSPQGRLDWYLDEAAASQLPAGLCV